MCLCTHTLADLSILMKMKIEIVEKKLSPYGGEMKMLIWRMYEISWCCVIPF